MLMCTGMPGTDTKLTPDIDAPIMPNATIYQGDLRSARKNASLLLLRAVRRLTAHNTEKYIRTVATIIMFSPDNGCEDSEKLRIISYLCAKLTSIEYGNS